MLDPFGGSMVTCRLAVEMGFEPIGVEIREDYVDQAARENGWELRSPAFTLGRQRLGLVSAPTDLSWRGGLS